MTDRELLELAAKAAHMPTTLWNDGGEPYSSGIGFILSSDRLWNPLTDDGDALRLAVKLHLWFRPMAFLCSDAHEVDVFIGGDGRLATEPANGDPLAATRRAIVRAAAEVGRFMP